MACEVEYTDEFEEWWDRLSPAEQGAPHAHVRLLAEYGVTLRFPYSSGVATSAHSQMRELRIQHGGRPYRVLYAFDPRRTAILLIGGDKTGDDRRYETMVPVADAIFNRHLAELEKED